MIVLDASAAGLKFTEEGTRVPHLIEFEIGQELRKFTISRIVEDHIAAKALDDWLSLDVERFPHTVLLGRVWQLRANVSAYDAACIALGARLVTADRRLAGVPGLQDLVVQCLGNVPRR